MEFLICRVDIICLILLASFSLYYCFGSKKDKNKALFLRLSAFSSGHVMFSIITIYTVNNMDLVPELLNRIVHVMFFLTGLLAHAELFKFVLRMSFPRKRTDFWKKVVYVPIIIYVIATFILPVEYVKGASTYYSYGTLVFFAYGISVVMSAICVVTYLIRWKYISVEVKYTVVPMSSIMLIMVLLQAVFPEMLMTSAGLSLVCIGVFFTLDNPIEQLKEQAYYDSETKVRNRNSYEIDIQAYKDDYAGLDMNFGVVVADINFLKTINDKYGHAQGDLAINMTAKLLRKYLSNAKNIYRIGGDEFIGIYIGVDEETMNAEIEEFRNNCDKVKALPIPLSVAVGCACEKLSSKPINVIINQADENMYAIKEQMHVKR